MSPAENAYGLQKRIAFCAQVIDAFQPRQVLDVGCGTGSPTLLSCKMKIRPGFRGRRM
jgi:ubiquinone/menaquinone biosynthesis C-methylase UbiE